jgi:hypothetical protein
MSNLDLISYLSGEIETLTATTMDFRSKIAFTFWIGPFVVLSSIILSADKAGETLDLTLSRSQLWAIAIAVSAYLVLGFFGGAIERQAWEKCNEWREAILLVQRNEQTDQETLKDLVLHKSIANQIHFSYLFVFFLMAIIFCASAFLAFQLKA